VQPLQVQGCEKYEVYKINGIGMSYIMINPRMHRTQGIFQNGAIGNCTRVPYSARIIRARAAKYRIFPVSLLASNILSFVFAISAQVSLPVVEQVDIVELRKPVDEIQHNPNDSYQTSSGKH